MVEMKILPNTQRLGKLTFDSNQVRKSKTNPNVLVAKASDGKDYGVVRKSDGSYDFAGSSRNSSFGDRMATASANPNIANRILDTAGLLMAEPQRMMTRKLTNNRYNNPEEVVADSKLPNGVLKNTLGFAAGMVADPSNAIGAGTGAKVAKLAMMLPAIPGLNKLFKSSKIMSKIGDTIQPFKSEIDWSKWNKEIPDNPKLIKEYNTIEQTSKANNTWMKNPDGSSFEGTPEQFVQQNSNNFKKSFPNPLRDMKGNIQTNYHESDANFNFFDENKFKHGTYGKGIYTTPNKSFGTNPYSLYINSNNPQNKFLPQDFGKNRRDYFELQNKLKNSNDIEKEEIFKKMEYLNNENTSMIKSENKILQEGNYLKKEYDSYSPDYDREWVIPFSNNPKSTIGNNGMFDMNNPNIYKGIVPGAIAAGAAASTMSNKDKNNKFKYGGKLLPLLK